MHMGALRAAALVVAALVLLVLALTVAAVFVGLYRLTEYNALHRTVRAPRYRLSELYPALKTGDLVLFVAATHSPANSVLTQTFFSHAGVLLRAGELVYIAEAQPGLELMPATPAGAPNGRRGAECRMRRGADLTPMLTRLKFYTGLYYVLRLSRPLDAAREEALRREAERLCRERYPYPSVGQILRGLLGGESETRHCFQHVAHLLGVARLDPLGRPPLREAGFCEVCRELCGIAGRPLPDGYYYEPPAQIVYDVGALDPGPPAAR
jgi:hypothetical protein